MSSNATCFHEPSTKQSPPLLQNGKLVIQAHHIGWIVTGVFTLVATCTSLWLVNRHLISYTSKHEQRYIVRILFMVPIYSVVSFASYLFWNHSTPLLLIRDCYESTVLTSFFYLLLLYASPNSDEQRAIFLKVGLSKHNDQGARRRGEPVKKWMFPLSSIKSKPADGLYFLQIMKWGILQYCVIRPTTTLAAVILDYVGLYCEDSWSPGWGHIYITIVVSISVSIAMYCLIQLYAPISQQLAPQRPLIKLFAIKAVVFLTFWQASLLSVLSVFGVIKNTQYMTADDINIGIGAIIETVEMAIFAFVHIKAFSYKPYQCPEHPAKFKPSYPDTLNHVCQLHTNRWRSLLHAFDFRETLRELKKGCAYMAYRSCGVETDTGARRLVIRDEIFGTTALPRSPRPNGPTWPLNLGHDQGFDPLAVSIDAQEEFNVDNEHQWLGVRDGYIHGFEYMRRERSAVLSEQIEVEMGRRGIAPWTSNNDQRVSSTRRGQRSWWRYKSLSHRDNDNDLDTQEKLEDLTHREARGRKYDCLPVVEEAYNSTISLSPLSESPGNPNPGYRSLYVAPSSQGQIATDDVALSHLFLNKPLSEASGPSSHTHPSSNGYHVRLTVPPPVVPSNEHRAYARLPTLTSPGTSAQGIRRQQDEFGLLRLDRQYDAGMAHSRKSLIGRELEGGDSLWKECSKSQTRHNKHRREIACHGHHSPSATHYTKQSQLMIVQGATHPPNPEDSKIDIY